MAERDANQRKHLEDSAFAEPEERKHPMEDPQHARNAPSRVASRSTARHGTAAEQQEVCEHVEQQYPSPKKD